MRSKYTQCIYHYPLPGILRRRRGGSSQQITSPPPAPPGAHVRGTQANMRVYEYQQQWGLGLANASAAYARGSTGKNITIGITDSGLM